MNSIKLQRAFKIDMQVAFGVFIGAWTVASPTGWSAMGIALAFAVFFFAIAVCWDILFEWTRSHV